MEYKVHMKERLITGCLVMVCATLFVTLMINCSLIFKSVINKQDIPSVNGVFPLIVLTDSMNPVIESGDLIVCEKQDISQICKGDIITYCDKESRTDRLVTHRVVDIVNENGEIMFLTQGDANNKADDDYVSEEQVIGVYKMRLANMGHVILFMQSKAGLVVFIVCPVILYALISIIKRKREEKKIELLKKELDELREFHYHNHYEK